MDFCILIQKERMTVNIMIENTEKNRYIFGIDIGGTACKLGLFHEDGTLLEKWQIPTDRANGGMNVFADLAAAVDSKLEEKSINREDVIGIGAGVPASISGEGVVQKCPALGWSNFNVADKITEVIGFPAVCGNDANLAASGRELITPIPMSFLLRWAPVLAEELSVTEKYCRVRMAAAVNWGISR